MASSVHQRPRRWWTEDEDQILRREAELQINEGSLKDWNRIAKVLPGRSNKDCRKRWSKVSNQVKKGMWTHEEDRRLEAAVAVHGSKWTNVARIVATRHADQCAKRWRHSLNPNLDRGLWSPEDDRALLLAVATNGRNWKAIGERRFPNRSTTDIKNRYVILDRRRRNNVGGGTTARGSRSAPPPPTNSSFTTFPPPRLLSLCLPPASSSAPNSALTPSPTASNPFNFEAYSDAFGGPTPSSLDTSFMASMHPDPAHLQLWLSMWSQSSDSTPTESAPTPAGAMSNSVPFSMAPTDYSLQQSALSAEPAALTADTSRDALSLSGANTLNGWQDSLGLYDNVSTSRMPVSAICTAGFGNISAPTSAPVQGGMPVEAVGRRTRRSHQARPTYYNSPTAH